jgi:hypothetical protein
MFARRSVAIFLLCSAACTGERTRGRDSLGTVTPSSSTAASPAVADTGATPVARAPNERGASGVVAGVMGNPLLSAIRDTLRGRNPEIGSVGIIEQRSVDYIAGPSVIIAYGLRADHDFKGSFQDELFGVFIANDSLTRIVRVLEVFPTPRWRDYVVRIVRLTPDSVRIEGKGASYGDEVLNRAYPVTALDSVAPPA